jgi:hypothetical protein
MGKSAMSQKTPAEPIASSMVSPSHMRLRLKLCSRRANSFNSDRTRSINPATICLASSSAPKAHSVSPPKSHCASSSVLSSSRRFSRLSTPSRPLAKPLATSSPPACFPRSLKLWPLERLWDHPNTPATLKKRTLRMVPEEIVADPTDDPPKVLLKLHCAVAFIRGSQCARTEPVITITSTYEK